MKEKNKSDLAKYEEEYLKRVGIEKKSKSTKKDNAEKQKTEKKKRKKSSKKTVTETKTKKQRKNKKAKTSEFGDESEERKAYLEEARSQETAD